MVSRLAAVDQCFLRSVHGLAPARARYRCGAVENRWAVVAGIAVVIASMDLGVLVFERCQQSVTHFGLLREIPELQPGLICVACGSRVLRGMQKPVK